MNSKIQFSIRAAVRYLVAIFFGTFLLLLGISVFTILEGRFGLFGKLIASIIPIMTVLGSGITIYRFAFEDEDREGIVLRKRLDLAIEQKLKPPFEDSDRLSNPPNLPGSSINWSDKTEQEVAAHIIRSGYWNSPRKERYPELAKSMIARILSCGRIPIGREGLERILAGLGAISGGIFVLFYVDFLSKTSTGPDILIDIAKVTPPVFKSTGAMTVSLLVLAVIGAYITTRRRTQCEKCGSHFSLQNVGLYYRDEGVHEIKDTDEDGNPYTYFQIDGKRIVYCPSCERISVKREQWTQEPYPHPKE